MANDFVYRPEENEYAIVIKPSDAYLLRDVLRRAADDRAKKAGKASRREALTRNVREQRVLAHYAQRCEYIRVDYAKRIGLKLASQD